MLKQTVEYVDFDGNPAVDTLYFNLSKAELTDNLDLKDRMEDILKIFSGPEHQLSNDEVKAFLGIIKDIMRRAYGVRSEDGKRFRKSPELWEEFTETSAYDAFLFSLFEDPDKGTEFLIGVFPADLVAASKAELDKQGVDTSAVELPTAPPVLEEKVPTERTFDDYTQDELLNMSQEQFQQLVGTDVTKMTPDQLQIAIQRMNNAK